MSSTTVQATQMPSVAHAENVVLETARLLCKIQWCSSLHFWPSTHLQLLCAVSISLRDAAAAAWQQLSLACITADKLLVWEHGIPLLVLLQGHRAGNMAAIVTAPTSKEITCGCSSMQLLGHSPAYRPTAHVLMQYFDDCRQHSTE
jgi:hypothetical protein